MIILKITKKQGFTLSLENTFLKKLQEGQVDPPPSPHPPALLGLGPPSGNCLKEKCSEQEKYSLLQNCHQMKKYD